MPVRECRSALEPIGECGSGSAGRTLRRSGVEPPTGTIHPRQISTRNSKSGKAQPEINPLTVFCPLFLCPCVDGSFRSGVQPPTGSRRESSTPAKYLPRFQIRKSIPATNPSNCFLSSIPLSSRGWIVPVGGSTPDRLKVGKLHPCRISVCNSKSGKFECRSWNAGRGVPVGP